LGQPALRGGEGKNEREGEGDGPAAEDDAVDRTLLAHHLEEPVAAVLLAVVVAAFLPAIATKGKGGGGMRSPQVQVSGGGESACV